MNKSDIIKNLRKHRRQLSVLIDGLVELDSSDDTKLNRVLVNTITFTIFEFIDSFVNTEADIYNYMRGRE